MLVLNGEANGYVDDPAQGDEAVRLHPATTAERRAPVRCAPLTLASQRSDLNAARTSVEKSSGSSQAAKWPPLSTSWKYATFG